MNETIVTVTGRVATPVEFRRTQSGVPAARFRIAATERRYDQERGGWGDGHTNWYTVWTWRQLAGNVTGSVAVGEPVVVQGKLRLREWEYEGKRHTEARIDAVTVGHDLSQGTAAFHRTARARPEGAEQETRSVGSAEAKPDGEAETEATAADEGIASTGEDTAPGHTAAEDTDRATEDTRAADEDAAAELKTPVTAAA
ncbi:single-stranded DNA-binding protein [Streptomyces boninensis]|uniref:single-stranded DNA-binding protein n=1 Tax=Streptomyces boninensis TaxID=2039455 RepID=UPI003B221127